jgi:DNA-binding GntR family transcriptional regulator
MIRKRTGTSLIANDIHQRLRDKILSLEIKPGARLVEDEICELLEAGRTPVREALLRLQGEGLVSRDRGWIVSPNDPSAFRTIFESRMAIEGYATRLAAQRATPADIDRLAALIDEMDRGDALPRAEINRLNRSFHQQIVALSDNPFFVETHERTQFNYWNLRLPVIFMKDQLLHSADEHKRILAALRARDGDAAERATREHIATTMAIVADALKE